MVTAAGPGVGELGVVFGVPVEADAFCVLLDDPASFASRLSLIWSTDYKVRGSIEYSE